MRINKFLADCGVASRRKSEQFVLDGRVKINGRVVKTLGVEVEYNDVVTLDGVRLDRVKQNVYIMLNKPKGYVTTTSDDKGRPTVLDLVKVHEDIRLYPVGRLDYETEGLILMTNDGELANTLMHPRHKVEKTYVARITGHILPEHVEQLRKGVEIDGQMTLPCRARLLEFGDLTSRVEVIITEGRNRQVRKMLEAVGYAVEFLKRTAIGPIKLGGLSRGEYRHLKDKEVAKIKEL